MDLKLANFSLFTFICGIGLTFGQEDHNPILNPSFFYAFPNGYTPSCASNKGLTYCDDIETEQYPGELIYVLLKMSRINYTKILREEQVEDDEIPSPTFTVKYCHKFDQQDEYCQSEKYKEIRNFGRKTSTKNTSRQESAKEAWLELMSTFQFKKHHLSKRQTTSNQDRQPAETVRRRAVPFCGSRTTYVKPTTAINKNSDWMWIVNMPEISHMTQVVKTVVCLPGAKDRPCLDCDTSFGYSTICKQKYTQRRLLALHPTGTDLVLDSFSIPIGCHCMRVRKNSF